MLILFIILIVVVVVVVVNDDTDYWVYWSSDHQFQVYYKVRQLLLQGATAHFITKCTGLLLQSATAFFYYKERQVLLQSATILLQSVMGITKCDRTVYREKYRKISFFILAKKGWVVAVRFFYFGMHVRRLFEDDPMR